MCHCERASFASEAGSQRQKGLLRRLRTATRKDKEGYSSYLVSPGLPIDDCAIIRMVRFRIPPIVSDLIGQGLFVELNT